MALYSYPFLRFAGTRTAFARVWWKIARSQCLDPFKLGEIKTTGMRPKIPIEIQIPQYVIQLNIQPAL